MTFDRLSQDERKAMGRRLRAARHMADLTVRGVAAEMGVHTASVTQWESGTVPVEKTRARLAELYGHDEDLLFSEIVARRQADADLLRRPA